MRTCLSAQYKSLFLSTTYFSVTAPSDDDSSAKKQVKVIGGQVESESSPVKADDSTLASDNAVKSDAPMTDAEKAAKRAARFGVTPTVTSQSQKSARAER